MNKTTYTIIGILIIAIIAIIAFTGSNEATAPTATSTPEDQISTTTEDMSTTTNQTGTSTATTSEETTDSGEAQTTVTYSNSGFAPSTVTVDAGTTVVFENNGSSGMWVASDQHPTHTLYSGTSLSEHCSQGGEANAFDSCTEIGAGSSWAFTFEKVGEWRYHNHVAPNHTGTIIVE